jgi:EpsI family protein
LKTANYSAELTTASSRPLSVQRVRGMALALLMVGTALAGEALRPTYRLSEHKSAIKLETQVPEAFGDWRLDRSITPVVPDPSLQAALDVLYSQTLARTYVNNQGQRVMLSIAYGSDQSNEATAVHRPEFCYSAQGFRVEGAGATELSIGALRVPAQRLVGKLGPRIEPITYWVTLDEQATLPGIGRRIQQLRYGLKGQIPDGMLMRVSSISPVQSEAFLSQQSFLSQLYTALPAEVRTRYFGSTPAN